jgi:hypothetical protein
VTWWPAWETGPSPAHPPQALPLGSRADLQGKGGSTVKKILTALFLLALVVFAGTALVGCTGSSTTKDTKTTK